MTSRALKIALSLSVALNLLVICALVAAAFVLGARWPAERSDGRRHSAMQIVETLEPGPAAEARDRLRDAALAARPDFRAARVARREAIELASAETMDREAVAAALRRARESEMRGRTRIETDLVDTLAEADPETRRRLAPLLARRGHGHRPGRRRPVGPEPAAAPRS